MRKIVNKKYLRYLIYFFKILDVGKIVLYIFYEKYNLKVVVLVNFIFEINFFLFKGGGGYCYLCFI